MTTTLEHKRKSDIPFTPEEPSEYGHDMANRETAIAESFRALRRSHMLFRPSEGEPDENAKRVVEVGEGHKWDPGHMLEGFQALQQECWKIAEDHGWHDEPATFGDRIALIASEGSEALEEFRDGHDPQETYYNVDSDKPDKPEGVPSELADIIIRVLDFAEILGIDLDVALDTKMAYNRTREYRHGNKLI